MITAVTYVFNKWESAQPSIKNFDIAVRSIWEVGHGVRDGNPFGDSNDSLCTPVPLHPKPDAMSKSREPMAWHIDFYLNAAPISKDREKQLRQLDALSKVGLLEKSKEKVTVNNEIKDVTRYSLTGKGWGASNYSRNSSCFVYGTPRYLGINRFESSKATDNQTEIYIAYAKIGLESDDDLVPWATELEIQKEFPEVTKTVRWKEIPVALVHSEGKWIEYKSNSFKNVQNKNGKLTKQTDSESQMPDEMKRKINELNSLPPPTVDEIKKLLQIQHGVGQKNPWPTPRIDLPGLGKLPVDKIFTDKGSARSLIPHYSVAIYLNKERKAYDPIAIKTIPYLNTLERIGILTKHVGKNIPGTGKDEGKYFDAYIYELETSYKDKVVESYPIGFPLGESSVEFIDIQIAENNTRGYPGSSVRYKLKVMYKDPPSWMKDPELLNEWEELRGVIKHGMACDGEFEFDRHDRHLYGGAGSCWWAFNSYQNY